MVAVWVRIAAACACFATALWLTADGTDTYRFEWPMVIIALIAGVVLGIDATLQRVRDAIDRANERRRKRDS